jgi:ribosomal protein L19E
MDGLSLSAWRAVTTGQNVRKLVKDGFVIRKPQKVHSRARANLYAEAKRKVCAGLCARLCGEGAGAGKGQAVVELQMRRSARC